MVDWLPKNHEALYDQGQQTWEYLMSSPNRERMGFEATTPQGLWLDNEYAPKFQAFTSAFVAWKNPADRTPAMTKLLQGVEKSFQVEYRQLYTGFLKNSPLVTDKDLLEMGLPDRHSGGGTPAPVAKTYPDYDIDSGTIRHLILHFFDQGKKKTKAKPPGQHGAEIDWAILDAPPASIKDLVNSAFDTHTPFTLEFDENERGKTVYFCLRWENTRGQKGPWSEIQSAIVP
jgi:hypothetical protein